jgi:hypothetical protein
VLSLGALLIPGVLVHGAGHFAGDDTDTAAKLFAAELLGVGAMAAGFLPVAFTGASRRVTGYGLALAMPGVALFVDSFAADVYGVAMHQTDRGEPLPTDAELTGNLSYRYVNDPQEAHRHFLVPSLELKAGRFGLAGEWWWAPGRGSHQERVEGRFRLAGRMPGRTGTDGTSLDVVAATTRHEVGGLGAHSWAGEVQLQGRLDAERFARSLEGLFGELSLGFGTRFVSYDRAGLSWEDADDLLIFRTAMGMYVGHKWGFQGEVSGYYEHRRDTFTGGLLVNGLGSGFLGHFGVQGAVQVTEEVGFTAQAEVGAAVVAGLGVRFRYGGLSE